MRKERQSEYPKYTDAWLIERFLQCGSVEEALFEDGLPIPFSYITYRRKLAAAGIIKSPGRHTSLTEALHFFHMKAMSPGTPLERLYKQMPYSFRTSVETLHRIYDKVEQVSHRRQATALILHPKGDPDRILIGSERVSNPYYGKVAGALSIPMTFSAQHESNEDRVLRVLEQEVYARDAIEGRFAKTSFTEKLLDTLNEPLLTFDILDVRVACFELMLPEGDGRFSSFKIANHHFLSRSDIADLPEESVRLGVKEIVAHSGSLGQVEEDHQPAHFVSELNLALCFTEVDPSLKSA